jgi:hypothetical protein
MAEKPWRRKARLRARKAKAKEKAKAWRLQHAMSDPERERKDKKKLNTAACRKAYALACRKARAKGKEKPVYRTFYGTWRFTHLDRGAHRRIATRLRQRVHKIIRNGQRGGSAVRDLGCPVGEFKLYIEAQWQPDMTWDNWAIDGWHLDHIIPLAKFDLTDRAQFLQACHFTNYQPLWSVDNMRKGSRPTR